jgi:uncharacterized protein YggE
VSGGVEVTGFGSASAVPDVVGLDVGVRCEGEDAAAVLADASSRAAALADAARDHGLGPADLQSTATGVQPRYDRDGSTTGYTAHQSLRVTVRDPDRVGDLVKAFAGTAGNALTIERLTLEIADPAPLRERARAAAFGDARARAEQYAALAGRGLGKVRSVTDVVPSGAQPRVELMSARTGGMPVELGENSVTATVVVRWDWT